MQTSIRKSIKQHGDYMLLLLFACGGLVSGAMAKAVELPWISDELMQAYLGGVGSSLSIWLLIIVLIVVLMNSSRAKKALATSIYFVGMCVGYYVVAELSSGLAVEGFVVFWLLASITAAPVAALAIAWAIRQKQSQSRQGSLLAAAVLSAVVAIPIAQAALIGFIRPFGFVELLRIVTEIVFVGVFLLLLASSMKQRIKLLLAAVLWLPVMWLAFEGLLRFLSLLY